MGSVRQITGLHTWEAQFGEWGVSSKSSIDHIVVRLPRERMSYRPKIVNADVFDRSLTSEGVCIGFRQNKQRSKKNRK